MAEAVDPTSRAPVGTPIQWAILVLLAVIAVLLATEVIISPRFAAAQTTGAGGAGDIFAVAGQLTRDTHGVYLVDRKNGTICVYEYVGGERMLRLRAARTFIYDLQLDEHNTAPSPAEVAKLVAQARRLRDATTRPKP